MPIVIAWYALTKLDQIERNTRAANNGGRQSNNWVTTPYQDPETTEIVGHMSPKRQAAYFAEAEIKQQDRIARRARNELRMYKARCWFWGGMGVIWLSLLLLGLLNAGH